MAADVWPSIHAERQALADDLAGLAQDKWSTPSLCAGWTVHDALGHMLATVKMTPGKFFPHLIGSGFSFNKMVEKDIRAETAAGPESTLGRFREHLRDTTRPPGPAEAMLGESIIHPEDIRRPLGIKREYPVASVVTCLDFFKKSNLILGAKARIDGLTLKAADTDWSHGSGPEVTGPAIDLLLAMTGRSAGLERLSGPGLETLRARTR